jgi:hypothetical protein
MFKNFYLYIFFLSLFIIIMSFYNEYTFESYSYSFKEKFKSLTNRKVSSKKVIKR